MNERISDIKCFFFTQKTARPVGHGLTFDPVFPNETEFDESSYDGIYRDKTLNLIKDRWRAIRTFALYRRYSNVYNIRVTNNDITAALMKPKVDAILQEQRTKFKIQAAIGFILFNNKTKELRYWHASVGHDRLFDTPVLIENDEDFRQFMQKLLDKNFIEAATASRKDTSWSVHCITNVQFYVTPIADHPIGCPAIMSERVKRNRAIISADLDHHGKPHSDAKCLFRALALMRKQTATLEASTNHYFNQYIESMQHDLSSGFSGVTLSDIPHIERLFSISVTVYTFDDEQDTARLVLRSTTNNREKLNLHLEGNHFCLITNLRLYCKSYKCNWCSKLCKTITALKSHTMSCCGNTKYIYPWGEYRSPETIFEKLEAIGVSVDSDLRHYPYFAVFDFETYQDKSALPNPTPTITWEGRHAIASVSVCSNIGGYLEPKTFVNDNDNEYDVVKQMMEYLDAMAVEARQNMVAKYGVVFDAIKLAGKKLREKEIKAMGDMARYYVSEKITQLETELQTYISDLLVFGFNSKSFDIPLMMDNFLRYLQDTGSAVQACIKKQGQYMLLRTSNLRFLDITNFLAEGTSLRQYLSAMEIDDQKFFFCYDKLQSLDNLKDEGFPRHEEFFNKFTNTNISNEEYQHCKETWHSRGMKTLRDMLVYYNEMDTKPLVKAIEKHYQFLKDRDLDFKSAVSISGMSIRYLFKLKEAYNPVFLFGKKFQDIYHMVRSNIRGGLSLVFNRYQMKDVTKIRPDHYGNAARFTKVCLGYDVSAMYLGNLTLQQMPIGRFIVRRRENGFVMEKSVFKGEKAAQFIELLGHILGVKFQHLFNGDEKKLGVQEISVDGYGIKENETFVVQFAGCYYHSHMCCKTPRGRHDDVVKDMKNRTETILNARYLRALGHRVFFIWECEFDQLLRENGEMKKFCEQVKLLPDKRYMLSEKQIIKDVKQGKIFGMVEVDIETPEELKDYFSEYQPLTKHAKLSR